MAEHCHSHVGESSLGKGHHWGSVDLQGDDESVSAGAGAFFMYILC